MYSPIRQTTRKQYYASAFDKNCLLRVQQKKKEVKKRIDKTEGIPFMIMYSFLTLSSSWTTKEEGSKEEDRQEGADVIHDYVFILNISYISFFFSILSFTSFFFFSFFFFFFFFSFFLFFFFCLSIFLSILFFTAFFCCLSSFTRRRLFLAKALVYYCLVVFRRIAEYASLGLFDLFNKGFLWGMIFLHVKKAPECFLRQRRASLDSKALSPQ